MRNKGQFGKRQSDVGLGQAGSPAVLRKVRGLGRFRSASLGWARVQCPVTPRRCLVGSEATVRALVSWPPPRPCWHGMLRWEAGFPILPPGLAF